MLEQQGENELAVAEQKRFGMREQGSDAAAITAKTELAKAEEEWGARKQIANTEAETKRYGFDKDFEGKKYGADKDFEGKKYGADASVRAAEAQAKIAAENNAAKQALEEQKRIAAEQKERGRLEFRYAQLDQRNKASIDAAAAKLVEASMGKLTFADARAQVMAEREQAQGQQGGEVAPQEGATKALSSGRKVIFKNGKWQYAD